MSTHEILNLIRGYCDTGILFPVNPPLDPVKRGLFVTADIQEMLEGPWENEAEESEWKDTLAIMHAFVSGKTITVGKKRTKRRSGMMSPLTPITDGVWDIRSKKRVGGLFVEKDLFIGLDWNHRNNMGDKNSDEWEILIQRCQTKWRNLFFGYPALKMEHKHDYISNIKDD